MHEVQGQHQGRQKIEIEGRLKDPSAQTSSGVIPTDFQEAAHLRPAESAGRRYGRTFGQPIGRPKVRRADKYAEPIGQPNPGTVKSGGPQEAGITECNVAQGCTASTHALRFCANAE